MIEDFLSTRSLPGHDGDDGSTATPEADRGEGAPSTAAHPQWYRAEADEWERLAGQVSLISDREYFLSCASELRAKAAALESELDAPAAAGAGAPRRDGQA